MADVQTFEVDVKLAPAKHKILYSDRSPGDEQLLMRPLLRKTKNGVMVGG
jgi:hypothetical protein